MTGDPPSGDRPFPETLEQMGVDELITAAAAIDDLDDHDRWAYVGELQRRGDEDCLDAALCLCADADRVRRVLGLDVLGQLGWPRGRPHLEASLPVATDLAAGDTDPRVVGAAVHALSHLGDARGAPAVLIHAGHPSAERRWAVARALPGVAGRPADALVVAALVGLTGDAHPGVRDWATFGLYLVGADSAVVREALVARMGDEDAATAAEALRALAHLDDERVLAPLIRRLDSPEGDHVDGVVVEAARALADPRLLAPLRRLREAAQAGGEAGVLVDELDAAIAACDTGG